MGFVKRPRLWFDGAPDRVTRMAALLRRKPAGGEPEIKPPRVVFAKPHRKVRGGRWTVWSRTA